MTLAIGGSSSAGNSTVGQLWVNVLDYGARADNGVTDNSGPIQAAIDALAAMMAGVNVASGIVYIPSATESYCVTKPIYLDSSNIEIRGDGAGSVVYMIGGAHPVFIVGVSRVATSYVNGVATPVSIGTANRPDCFGVLDKTAAAAAGTVWGLRTYNNTFVQFQGSAISAGAAVAGATSFSDNWGTTNQLTIEFCIQPPAGTQFQPYTPILGMGSLGQTGPVQASPFMVSTGYEANMIQMMFRTAEMQPLSVRVFDFLLGTATPPYRVAMQIDLVNAVYSAYVNGVQVAFNECAARVLAEFGLRDERLLSVHDRLVRPDGHLHRHHGGRPQRVRTSAVQHAPLPEQRRGTRQTRSDTTTMSATVGRAWRTGTPRASARRSSARPKRVSSTSSSERP